MSVPNETGFVAGIKFGHGYIPSAIDLDAANGLC